MVLTNDFVVVCVQTKEEMDTASEVATMGSCGGRSAPTVPFYPGQGIRIRIDPGGKSRKKLRKNARKLVPVPVKGTVPVPTGNNCNFFK